MEWMLRTCKKDMSSHGGFVWPRSGHAEAPDWSDEPKCGGGLHGLLRGEGNGNLLDWSDDAVWCVVEVDGVTAVDLDGKVKVPCGNVVYSGDRGTATKMMVERYPGAAVVGAIVSAGYRGTATAGDRGAATAGDNGTATAGDNGTATAGDNGTATAGDRGAATAGDYGTIIFEWFDGSRTRCVVGYVGEDGIEPGVPYRCVGGRIVRDNKASR